MCIKYLQSHNDDKRDGEDGYYAVYTYIWHIGNEYIQRPFCNLSNWLLHYRSFSSIFVFCFFFDFFFLFLFWIM